MINRISFTYIMAERIFYTPIYLFFHTFVFPLIAGKLLCNNKSYVLPYLTVLMSAGTLFVNSRRREYMTSYPDAQFRLLPREDRRTFFGFNGGSSWHQIDGTIITHLYRHLKFYCVLVLIICVASAFVWYRRRNARKLLASVTHIFPPKNVRHFYDK